MLHSTILGAALSEFIGTAIFIGLGVAMTANLTMPRTKGHGRNWLAVSFGWGLAIFVGVYAAFRSGAHLNPAVTLGLLAANQPFYSGAYGVVAPTFTNALIYILAQLLGAFTGAVLAWVAYKQHYDLSHEPDKILGTFATGPQIRSDKWNFITEFIATFVLVFWVIVHGPTPAALGPLAVALVVVIIGLALGGPTGYAINPARDIGPRFAHDVLPIPGKGSSNWSYAWIPVLAPILAGILAGLLGAWWLRL